MFYMVMTTNLIRYYIYMNNTNEWIVEQYKEMGMIFAF